MLFKKIRFMLQKNQKSSILKVSKTIEKVMGVINTASLKTIAEKCGVSVATVSKALNDQKDIGKETKKRIKEVADELGYFPNAAARELKTNRSYNIGVLYEEDAGRGFQHEYFSGVLNGFKSEAEKLGFDITFINSSLKKRKRTYYEQCRYRNFDGVAIVCATFDNPDVCELMNSDIPTVTVDYVHHNCTAVKSDNVGEMSKLVQYIYEKGHRKIAYIHGQKISPVTGERVASFYRQMYSFGIDVPDEYVRTGEYLEIGQSAKQTKYLLDLPEPPTCILYPDDTSLIGGLNVILQRGLSIPNDISIAGFDGARMSQLLHPRLTTIKQNSELIGKELAKHLIEAIENPKTTLVERVVIGGELIEGESVGKIGN